MASEVQVVGSSDDEKSKEYGKYDKYEIEGAARTLLEAEAIRADADKMKYVSECLKKQADGMKKVIGTFDELKAVAKKKMAE